MDNEKIVYLDFRTFIRHRPGMFIGKRGPGSDEYDGLYFLLKEIIDNAIEEYQNCIGKKIEIAINERGEVCVRDHGHGIPVNEVIKVSTFDSRKGLCDYPSKKIYHPIRFIRGMGLKMVNVLSSQMEIISHSSNQTIKANFERGVLLTEQKDCSVDGGEGTLVKFIPDSEIFGEFSFKQEIVKQIIKEYTYFNVGLEIIYNGEKYVSNEGVKDLLKSKLQYDSEYPIIHLKGENIEIAFTHTKEDSEEIYTYVNGHFTKIGGTHLTAFYEHLYRIINLLSHKNFSKEYFYKNIKAVVSIRILEPIFSDAMKWNLASTHMAENSQLTIDEFIENFLKKELSLFYKKNPDVINKLVKLI